MTEDEARQICAEMQAVFCIRKRGAGKNLYVYVSRWLPKRAAEAAGYKVGRSNGQSFDRYVCALAKLDELSEEHLRRLIAGLPTNPNKADPNGQRLERTSPTVARWHAEAETPEPVSLIPVVQKTR